MYVPVETPTGDFYGGHRPATISFGESLVCLDARTGKRVWHFQMVHHGVWDWDPPTAPTLLDITVDGRPIKAVAQITKQAWVYVFDRVTGKPVWPIEERPVPQIRRARRTHLAHPAVSHEAPALRQAGLDRGRPHRFHAGTQGRSAQDRAQYRLGPIFTPPTVAGAGGKMATITLPSPTGGANWQGGAADPETGMLYVASVTFAAPVSLRARSHAAPTWTTTGQYSTHTRRSAGPAARQTAMGPHHRHRPQHRRARLDGSPTAARPNFVKQHPALKGVDLGQTGNPEHAPMLVTKTRSCSPPMAAACTPCPRRRRPHVPRAR